MIGRPFAEVPIWRISSAVGRGVGGDAQVLEQGIVGHAGHGEPGVELDDGRRPLDTALAVIARPAGDVEAQHVEHADQADPSRPRHALEVLGERAATATAPVDGIGHLVQRGLVRRHDHVRRAPTSSRCRPAQHGSPLAQRSYVVGDCVSREVGIVERAVTTVVGASVEATDDAVETGAPDELGATTGAVAVEAHAVVRSIKATRYRTRPPRGFDLTALSPRVRASVGGPDETQYSPLITKYEPRIVPASFDFWRANLNREASSSGTSMPSESLNPTARFLASSTPYITLIESPLS